VLLPVFVVGVNEFVEEEEEIEIPILYISKEVEEKQIKRLKQLRASRNQKDVKSSLAELKKSAEDGTNLMPRVLDCARNYVTLGEMCGELKEVFPIKRFQKF
jgi:methylmalonyl-CoA mutase N-terminal domain/subunit